MKEGPRVRIRFQIDPQHPPGQVTVKRCMEVDPPEDWVVTCATDEDKLRLVSSGLLFTLVEMTEMGDKA